MYCSYGFDDAFFAGAINIGHSGRLSNENGLLIIYNITSLLSYLQVCAGINGVVVFLAATSSLVLYPV
jgi:hypothetical protein